jgi:hypothetical protein
MLDLNQLSPIPHVTLFDPISINNLGQILVSGQFDPGYAPNGNSPSQSQYLLTPLELGRAEYGVPEPSTLALFGLLAGYITLRRWRDGAVSPRKMDRMLPGVLSLEKKEK